MTHRNQRRRHFVNRANTRIPSPILWRITFTILALLVWIFLVRPAFAQLSTPEAEPPATHTVQAGETLSEIARDNGVIVEQLMRLNGIPNPNAIYVGQVLRLPVQNQPADTLVHVVRSGESLSVIAKSYGVEMRVLMQENGIRDANNIVTGMELVIPDAGSGDAAQEPTPTRQPTPEPTDEPTAAPTTEPTATPGATPAPTIAGLQPDATLEGGLWVHVVKPGETASEIAKSYGVALATLLRANGIANANLIRVGAELVIPGTQDRTPGALPATATTAAVSGEPVIVESSTPTPLATEAPVAEVGAESSATAVEMSTDAPAQEELTEAEPASTVPVSATEIPTAVPLHEQPAASLNRTYTIVSGDTLQRIGLRLGIDADALRRLNKIEVGASLRAGQELLLPATDRELRVVSDAQQHVVRPGDSLSAIAKQYGISLGDLMSANRIVNPNIVSVGEELEIPGRALGGDGPLPRVGPARSGYYFYTVRPGDTLSELARDLNSTEIALKEYNNIGEDATVYNGMELRVPFGAPPLPVRKPPVPHSGSSFLVSLSRQQCWVYTGNEVRHAWNCSTGYDQYRTRTGSFAVQSKIEMAISNVWRLDMPFWLGIYDVGSVENGIHGLPISWATGRKIWTELIGEPATFGCAMLDDQAAETLFNLAYIGMPVHIIQ